MWLAKYIGATPSKPCSLWISDYLVAVKLSDSTASGYVQSLRRLPQDLRFLCSEIAIMSSSSIVELAARIATNTTIVNDFYTQNELPTPSFNQASPLKPVISPSTAPEIEAARQAVIYDCQELRILMQGPAQYLASLSVRPPLIGL